MPLSAELHERLRTEAARSGHPATSLARDAIETWLAERERLAVHEAIVSYAREVAGSPADLDPALEKAAVEHLVGKRPRR